MTPKKLKAALLVAIKANRPVMIWGSPGVGKSAVVRETAKDLGLIMRDERVSDRDPVDFRGLPHIEGGLTRWTCPDFLPRSGEGVLFLDELSAAMPAVQAVCYQLVLDRRLGDYYLPEGWRILAAGNKESDRAIVSKMSSALANRFIHLEFDVDLDDWLAWAVPAGIRPEIMAFLRFKPSTLHAFDPSRAEKSFPSPRTWEFVSDLMRADGAGTEFDLIAGTVGEGAAVEFLGFLKVYRELPSIEDIFRDPLRAKVPKESETSALYAVACAVGSRARCETADAALAYIGRLPEEFQVVAIGDALRATKNDFANSKAFISWSQKHQFTFF